jgi:hypothetical protein
VHACGASSSWSANWWLCGRRARDEFGGAGCRKPGLSRRRHSPEYLTFPQALKFKPRRRSVAIGRAAGRTVPRSPRPPLLQRGDLGPTKRLETEGNVMPRMQRRPAGRGRAIASGRDVRKHLRERARRLKAQRDAEKPSETDGEREMNPEESVDGIRAGVFIKACWAALARPVELLLARAEAPAWALELELAQGLGLPCTPKKSQSGRGQARAARWIQRPGLLPPRRQMLCSFFYFQNRPTAKIAASS